MGFSELLPRGTEGVFFGHLPVSLHPLVLPATEAAGSAVATLPFLLHCRHPSGAYPEIDDIWMKLSAVSVQQSAQQIGIVTFLLKAER